MSIATCEICGEEFEYDLEELDEEPTLCPECTEEEHSCGLQDEDYYPDGHGDGENEDDFFNEDK